MPAAGREHYGDPVASPFDVRRYGKRIKQAQGDKLVTRREVLVTKPQDVPGPLLVPPSQVGVTTPLTRHETGFRLRLMGNTRSLNFEEPRDEAMPWIRTDDPQDPAVC